MQEIWKDIKGYEGLYQVSNFSRIKCIERIVPTKNQYGISSSRKIKSKILKPYKRNSKRNDNHLVVCLYKNNKSKLFFIHRLIAEAFIPNPNNYPIINHIDGNPLNNKINNLEWSTIQMNTQHAYNIGLAKPTKTRKINQYTLNDDFIKSWDTIKEAEQSLNLHHIGDCCRKLRNRAGNYHWRYAD